MTNGGSRGEIREGIRVAGSYKTGFINDDGLFFFFFFFFFTLPGKVREDGKRIKRHYIIIISMDGLLFFPPSFLLFLFKNVCMVSRIFRFASGRQHWAWDGMGW
ncbi:hypothetical protein F4810DRAFT_663975 [Camillea tinctor]|nr:hypothetical protein F4810DRAFT_663975 [Camillea tinctor]